MPESRQPARAGRALWTRLADRGRGAGPVAGVGESASPCVAGGGGGPGRGRSPDGSGNGGGGGGGGGCGGDRARIVVVGSGFAGLRLLCRLETLLPADAAEIIVVSPVDHLLYTSLIPQVCASSAEPRHLAVAVRGALRRAVLRLGHAVAVDTASRTVTVRGNDGVVEQLGWDRLVLAPGSVTKLFDIPGVREHALGLKNLAEAVYLRDHVLRQLERADSTDDAQRRRTLCTFVVVGGGYAGTELAAQMTRFTRRAVASYPRLRAEDVRWILVDHAPRILHELAPTLGRRATRVLTDLGVDLRLRTSVGEVTDRSVRLDAAGGSGGPGGSGGSGGSGEPAGSTTIDTHTVVWCAGVAPSPLIAALGLPTTKGRLTVDEYFRVPTVDGLFALGDAAAVPDLTRSGAPAGQTAQHAIRQAAVAASNVAASLGHGGARPYRHHDLGFVVDLGGRDAVANPLGLTLAGLPAVLVTRGYHLYALNNGSNRARVLTDWVLDLAVPHQIVQLGFARGNRPTIAAAEDTEIYAQDAAARSSTAAATATGASTSGPPGAAESS